MAPEGETRPLLSEHDGEPVGPREDTHVPSPGGALIVWLIGGILAWTGASTMAELGTAIPGEGECHEPLTLPTYLSHVFGAV